MTTRSQKIESLYLAEHERLERQIRGKVGPAVARDLVHDVFLRIWEKATELTGDPSAFLTRCARNAAIDHARAEQRRSGFLGAVTPEQYSPPLATPLEIVIARDGIRSVEVAIAALPRQTRHIFLLNRIHGRSFAEIALVLDISERAVAKHMARAMVACESASSDPL